MKVIKFVKFSGKETNKFIAQLDRYFTWHKRTIIPGKSATFFNHDTGDYVNINRTSIGMWCYYNVTRNGSTIKWGKYLNSFADVKNFIRVIQVIG